MMPPTARTHDLIIIINRLRERTDELRGFARLTCQDNAPNTLAAAFYRADDDTGAVLVSVEGSRASWQLSWLVVHATGEGFNAMTERMMRPERWRWFMDQRLRTFDRLGTGRHSIAICLARMAWAGNTAQHRKRLGRLRTSDDSPTCSGLLVDDTSLG